MLILFSLLREGKPSSLKKLILVAIGLCLVSCLAYFIGGEDIDLHYGFYCSLILNACILYHLVIDFINDLKQLKNDWQAMLNLAVIILLLHPAAARKLACGLFFS